MHFGNESHFVGSRLISLFIFQNFEVFVGSAFFLTRRFHMRSTRLFLSNWQDAAKWRLFRPSLFHIDYYNVYKSIFCDCSLFYKQYVIVYYLTVLNECNVYCDHFMAHTIYITNWYVIGQSEILANFDLFASFKIKYIKSTRYASQLNVKLNVGLVEETVVYTIFDYWCVSGSNVWS